MLNEDLISIVIPAYNIQNYLGLTLDSVLAQTYKNLEIIIINDGSKDNTGVVADAYAKKDSRIRVIHKENGGVTSARLRGVAEAAGDYIGFVDGDDIIEPQMYAFLMENLQANNASISHCGYQMVFPSRIDYYYNTGKFCVQTGEEACTDLLDGKFIEPGLCNKIYRKELFAGLYEWMNMSIRTNEDLLMNFYLFRQAEQVVYEDQCPYHYVLRAGSASTSRLNEHKLNDPLLVLHTLMDETADHPQWNKIVQHRLVYQLIRIATLSASNQPELIKPARRQSRRELRHRLRGILKGNVIGLKLKIMALWAAVWPWSYCMAHRLYWRIQGAYKRYEIK